MIVHHVCQERFYVVHLPVIMPFIAMVTVSILNGESKAMAFALCTTCALWMVVTYVAWFNVMASDFCRILNIKVFSLGPKVYSD